MTNVEIIQLNLQRVHDSIRSACVRAGRMFSEVTLVAVTKYAQEEWVDALYSLGVRNFGESRPQQLLERQSRCASDVRWHLIGSLQRNKVRPVLEAGALIHSVDSVKLLDRIELLAGERGQQARVLLEVNLTGEPTKHGFTEAELREWGRIETRYSSVSLAGLMTMAAETDDAETARPVFHRLRQLRDDLRSMSDRFASLQELSMGMSGDFEVAIEEGATLVRVGSALFEGLSS